MSNPRNFTGLTLVLVTSLGLLTLAPEGALSAEIHPIDSAETRTLDNGGSIPVDVAVDGIFANGQEPEAGDDVIVIDQHACELLFERGHSGLLYYPGKRDQAGNVLSLVRFVPEDEEREIFREQYPQQPPAGNPPPPVA